MERNYNIYVGKAGHDQAVHSAPTLARALAEALRQLTDGALWVEVRNMDGDILLNAETLAQFERASFDARTIIRECAA